jgi:hypothetical protein
VSGHIAANMRGSATQNLLILNKTDFPAHFCWIFIKISKFQLAGAVSFVW